MKVECRICGKSFYNISASHLRTHGMTRSDYSKLYGSQGLSNTNNFKKVFSEIDKYLIERAIQNSTIKAMEIKKTTLMKRVG